jgi:hypothetical protein
MGKRRDTYRLCDRKPLGTNYVEIKGAICKVILKQALEKCVAQESHKRYCFFFYFLSPATDFSLLDNLGN